jgi:hypothetical protein
MLTCHFLYCHSIHIAPVYLSLLRNIRSRDIFQADINLSRLEELMSAIIYHKLVRSLRVSTPTLNVIALISHAHVDGTYVRGTPRKTSHRTALRHPSGIQKAPSRLTNATSQPHNPASPLPSNLPNQPPALKHATPISRSRPPMTPFLPYFPALSNFQMFWKVTLSK